MASPSKLSVGDRSYEIYRLDELQASYDVARLPYTLRVLLENVLRNGDDADVDAVARWDARSEPANEISFAPSRVLLQDLTGVLLALAHLNHVIVVTIELIFGIRYGAHIPWIFVLGNFGLAALGNMIGGIGLVTLNRFTQAKAGGTTSSG